jgi:adenine-specific DNA-methyltransferase
VGSRWTGHPPFAYIRAVRYIGNKTRLLGFIGAGLRGLGIAPGTAVDPFTGTASVARALKGWGWRVVAGDVMEYGYVFGRAYVALTGEPRFETLATALGAGGHGTAAVLRHLERLPPEDGFLAQHFAPAAAGTGRRYFTPENAGRIDAIRRTLAEWHEVGLLDRDGFHYLLAALLEAADRVANTTGVYAAYVKSWQPNALRPLRLRPTAPVPGNGCRAVRGDAVEIVAGLGRVDLLYLDPPYNERQYPGYYHLPELIATGWFGESPPALRGKTGLIPDAEKRSDWSRRGRCESAFEAMLAAANCRHVLMSYNTEGILPEATIERVLKAAGRAATFRRFERRYRRYRSDADGAGRRYRGDEVAELLYYVAR